VTADDVAALERTLAAGGVALFPSDTVYGLAADAESAAGVRRLYEIKRRPAMPSAVMFFSLEDALTALPDVGKSTTEVLERLLPGPLTVIVPNPARRFPLAQAGTSERLGVRVPRLEGSLAPLTATKVPVIQSSANLHGGGDAHRLEDVATEVRAAVDCELDGGELPGTASTVVDLARYEIDRRWTVLRDGAVSRRALADVLDA
jgi:L-threonylcarbamoyladenylate synthase